MGALRVHVGARSAAAEHEIPRCGWLDVRSVSLAPVPSLPHARQSAPEVACPACKDSRSAPMAVCQASPLAFGGWQQGNLVATIDLACSPKRKDESMRGGMYVVMHSIVERETHTLAALGHYLSALKFEPCRARQSVWFSARC